MLHPTDRITHTTAFVTPVVEHWLEREIAQWVHHEGSMGRPIAPRANALTTELHHTSEKLAVGKLKLISCQQMILFLLTIFIPSSVVRAFAHGAMGRRIDPSCGETFPSFRPFYPVIIV